MNYGELLEKWLSERIKPFYKQRTYERYALSARLHVKNALGGLETGGITAARLQAFLTSLGESGNLKKRGALSANTVNAVITVIKKSLDYACFTGLIRKNPAAALARPKRNEKPVECFTVAEQKKIEAAVKESKKDKMRGVILCLYTGLRIGELLALEWADVDLQSGSLTVNKSCHDTPEGLAVEKPKTFSSNRVIPLPKQLLPYLKEWRKKSRSPRVINDGGKEISVRSYQRSFELLLKRAGVRHKGFHSLRHTFATRALECGMDVKTLSEMLGHKNPAVTLTRYAHSLTEHKREMMNRLGKLL